jgi:hypothetical protein
MWGLGCGNMEVRFVLDLSVLDRAAKVASPTLALLPKLQQR